MHRLPSIRQLTVDALGAGFFLCTRKDRRTTRSGTPFLLLTLQDATGEIGAKLFEDVDRHGEAFDAGDFVRLEARTEIYLGRLELVLERIRRVDPAIDAAAGFREEDCVLTSPCGLDAMWSRLLERISAVGDAGIRALLLRVVEAYGGQLRVWPAALTVHHAYRGGLLEHVLSVARVCDALAGIYGADQDLLVAGAILHDVGKLRELDYETAVSYSRDGNLVGHITLGMLMVREAAEGLASLPHDRLMEIEHLIASHHGSRDRGSPVEPLSLEAFILSAADELDATLHQVKRHIDSDDGDGEFTGYYARLGRVLLKPRA